MTKSRFADAVGRAFAPVLRDFGFVRVPPKDEVATFETERVRLTASFDWRDGDVAIRIQPRDDGPPVYLSLYLQAIGSETSKMLKGTILDTEAEAIAQLPIWAAGLTDAKALLIGDPDEVARARGLRWWNASGSGGPHDIAER
jgi:hypothetical protein